MPSIKITASIPHVQKEYNISVPDNTTGKRLYEAIMAKAKTELRGDDLAGVVVYELFAKHAKKKVYPDLEMQTLAQIGLKEGETLILKKDMDPGMC